MVTAVITTVITVVVTVVTITERKYYSDTTVTNVVNCKGGLRNLCFMS